MAKKKKAVDSANAYLKYSGMAMQLLVLLLLAAWGGQKLDSYFELSQPFITIAFLLGALGAFLFRLVRDVSKPS